MKNIIFYSTISFLLFFTLNSCKTTCCHNITPVSFGVNSNIINCITVTKVYVDNNEIGEIPGTTSNVISCNSPDNLNVEFGESGHLYKIVVMGIEGDTVAIKEGEFDVTDSDCIKIFFDLSE